MFMYYTCAFHNIDNFQTVTLLKYIINIMNNILKILVSVSYVHLKWNSENIKY